MKQLVDARNEELKINDMVKCHWKDLSTFAGTIVQFDQPTFNGKGRNIFVQGLYDRRTGRFPANSVLKMNDGEKMLYRLEQ